MSCLIFNANFTQENDSEMLIIELLYRIREHLTHILCPQSANKTLDIPSSKKDIVAQNYAFIFIIFFLNEGVSSMSSMSTAHTVDC